MGYKDLQIKKCTTHKYYDETYPAFYNHFIEINRFTSLQDYT